MNAKGSHAVVRLVCGLVVLLLAACDHADLLAPPTSSTAFDTVEVTPDGVELSVVAPGNTVELTVRAFDQNAREVSIAGGVVTYSSSVPTTATVDSSGVVTAVAPGTTLVTVTLTLGDVTRTGDATVSVFEPGAWPAVGGVYDLTALITDSDPAWGVEDGTTQVALLSIEHAGDRPQFTGTFSDFRATPPGGDDLPGQPGSVSGTVHTDGRLVLELTFSGSQSSYWYGEGTVTAQGMAGEFGAGGHIVGTFTAGRR